MLFHSYTSERGEQCFWFVFLCIYLALTEMKIMFIFDLCSKNHTFYKLNKIAFKMLNIICQEMGVRLVTIR